MTETRRWSALTALAAVVGLSGCTWVSNSGGQSTNRNGLAGAAGEGIEDESTGGVEDRGSGGSAAKDSGAGGGSSQTPTGGSFSEADGGNPGAGGASAGGKHTGGAHTGGASTGGQKQTGGSEQTGGKGSSEPIGGAGGAEETGGTGGAEETGGTGGAETGGAETGGAETGGAETGGAETGGAETGGAETGGTATGGTGGTATGGTGGAATGGTGGTATGGTGGDDSVHGRVIDFWGHALPGITVDVDGTLTQTDDDGEFVVQDVSPQYDASLVISLSSRNYGWVYQGLTRRDPTLQVYRGLEQRYGNFTVTPQNGTFDPNRTLTLAFGGPDGSKMHDDVNPAGVTTSTWWFGPEQTTATAHGLLWQYDEDTDLPTSYVAYDSRLVALDESSPAEFNLDLTSETITSGNVQGTVVPVTSTDRVNAVFVRFNTGATIEVARDSAGPDTFTYLVPTLPNGSISVSAAEGDSSWGPFSMAHADGLAASATVSLTLSEPASLVLPASGTTDVTASTPFQFTPGEDSGGAYLVVISSYYYYSALFIVTAEEHFTIPTVAQGAYVLMADELYDWWVETHGKQATVDEMAGPNGFLDAYFPSYGELPDGRRQGDGEYTFSDVRSFTTAE